MPNNTQPIFYTQSIYGGSIPVNPQNQQNPYGNVTTDIYTFFSSFFFPLTNSFGTPLYLYGTSGISTSSTPDVSDYNNYSFQAAVFNSVSQSFTQSTSQSISSNITTSFLSYFTNSFVPNSTASFYISSSIDGYNWVGEFSFSLIPIGFTTISSSVSSSLSQSVINATNSSSFSSSFTSSFYSLNSTQSIFRITGGARRHYFGCFFSGSNNSTGSLYGIFGQ